MPGAQGAALALGAASATHILGGSARSLARMTKNMADLVLPSGAMGAERFRATCTRCYEVCPKGAIFMAGAPNGMKVPNAAVFHCMRSGACQSVCPMTPKAITVTGAEQSIIGF